MVKDEVPEAGSEPLTRQGTHGEGDILTEDRVSGRARPGRLAPASEEPARTAARPEGLEFRELPSRYEEDEISLVDLWLVLVRRRLIIVAAVLACILAGLLFALLQPPLYAFTTTIQIGRIVELPGLLESTETVAVKLNEGYIPKVLAAYVNEADDRTALKIEASSPKQSQMVLIKSKTQEKESELHLDLHKRIIETLLADHAILIGNFRKALEIKIKQAQDRYASLSDEARLLVSRLELLDGTKDLVAKQVGEIQDLLSSTASGLERALPEVSDEAKALTFLMVGNEIQQNRNRLATLEERLHIGLPQERNALEKRLADMERTKVTQVEAISALETRLSSIRETRVIVGPARSLEPVGPGRAVILALAGVLGLFLGIFAAFFAEFLAKARAAMVERETAAVREPVVRGG